MVRPLYDYIFPILEDINKANREGILCQMGKSLKRFLRVRESMSSKILMQLIGNVDSYIINRAGNAKAKIEERFKKKISTRTQKIPKLLPNISLIPDEYVKLINLLGFGICKVCKERLTWYHLAKHSHLIRNPELVVQYKIQQWKQIIKRILENCDSGNPIFYFGILITKIGCILLSLR